MEEVIVDVKDVQRSVDAKDGNLTIRVRQVFGTDETGNHDSFGAKVKPLICKNFTKSGICRKVGCKFLHEKKKCSYFKSQMGCRDGDNCKFQHYRAEADASIEECYSDQLEVKQLENEIEKLSLLESENKNSSQKKSKIMCRFMKKGNCNKEDCQFSHDINKGREKTSSENAEQNQNQDIRRNKSGSKTSSENAGKNQKFDSPRSKTLSKTPSEDTEENQKPAIQSNKTISTIADTDMVQNADVMNSNQQGSQISIKCPNLHEKKETKDDKGSTELKSLKAKNDNNDTTKQTNNEDKVNKPPKRKCIFFNTKNKCRAGDNCLFAHIGNQPNGSLKDQTTTVLEDQLSQEANSERPKCEMHNKVRAAVSNANPPLKTSAELRETELKQLEKRWKGHFECKQTEPTVIYNVEISPTDPDWPFVVKEFVVQVEFPQDYPEQLFMVSLQESDQFPPYFRGFMNDILQSWLAKRKENRDTKDLAFRPFCRWFDRELSRNFEFAANKVKLQMQANAFGITLVHHKSILPQQKTIEKEDDEEEEGSETVEIEDTLQNDTNVEFSNELFTNETDKNGSKCSSNVKKGTEVKLPDLHLSESVGTFRIKSALLVVQCERCKTKHDYNVFNGQKANGACKKCHQEQSVVYHSELMHHFSPVAGYLHLANCRAFDFILNDSTVVVNCLECNKDNTLKGLLTSAKKEYWCQHCHKKIEIKISHVKFSLLQPSGAVVNTSKKSNQDSQQNATKKKIHREPGIKEGEALPGNGACKHYKKSFRWLRFPCCGKAYPCDICHDEGENNDHEMKIANKMICGFCSKEQPFFRDKPCISCKSGVTKGRSAHWEGGKGCRDKSKMARGDKHKTAGQGKTIPRKKEDVSQKKK